MFNLGTHTHSMTYSDCVRFLHLSPTFYEVHILPQKLWEIKYGEDNYLKNNWDKMKKSTHPGYFIPSASAVEL